MKKFFDEFKKFALRGNVIDLAVGVIIGAAFQSIVNSMVEDIISPLIGLFVNVDFKDLQFMIPGTDVAIKYGSFLTALINFIIMALVIFLIVKGINKLSTFGKKPKEDGTPATKTCSYCCSEIPYPATRCPSCTSELAPVSDGKAAGANQGITAE